MKRKLFAATLCASMVAGLVVVPTVAHADESKGPVSYTHLQMCVSGHDRLQHGRRCEDHWILYIQKHYGGC